MINKSKILTIIPARKNSKGLKNKNKIIFRGKPLFFWPVTASLKSKYIDKIIISSDDKDILNYSYKFKNKKIEFINRPKKLASDKSKTFDVIKHSINYLSKNNNNFDYILLLEPTSPLTTYQDIDHTIKKLHMNRDKADSIVSLTKNEKYHPFFNFTVKKNQIIQPIIPLQKDTRRQNLPKVYYIDGSIYFSKIQSILKHKTFIHKRTLACFLKDYKSIEIDNIVDFLCAEFLSKNVNLLK